MRLNRLNQQRPRLPLRRLLPLRPQQQENKRCHCEGQSPEASLPPGKSRVLQVGPGRRCDSMGVRPNLPRGADGEIPSA